MKQYHFITSFSLFSPVTKIWEVLIDFAEWKSWWKGVKEISLSNTIPPVIKLKIGVPFYYLAINLHVKEIVPGKKISLIATGDLVGTGEFSFVEEIEKTKITFTWDVATTKLWMNLSEPLLRPVFTFSHNTVMQWFIKGLAKKVKTNAQENLNGASSSPAFAISPSKK